MCSTPGLAGEPEHQRITRPADVAALQGGQPEGTVGVAVGVVPDAEVANVEQADGGRCRPLHRHAVELEVARDPAPRRGQVLRRCGDPFELGAVATHAPGRVVEVLAAAGVVGADGLKVSVGVGADPHVGPGRGDGEGADALHLGSVQGTAVGVPVAEAPTVATAGVPGRARIGAAQAHHASPGGSWTAPNARWSSSRIACDGVTSRASMTCVEVAAIVSTAAATASLSGQP